MVVRLAFFHTLSDPDFLWATVDVAIWSTVEEGLAITAGSLATLHPLLRIVLAKLGLLTATSDPSGAGPARCESSAFRAYAHGPGNPDHKPCGVTNVSRDVKTGVGPLSGRTGGVGTARVEALGMKRMGTAAGLGGFTRSRRQSGQTGDDSSGGSSEVSFEGVRIQDVVTVVRDGPQRGDDTNPEGSRLAVTSSSTLWTDTAGVRTHGGADSDKEEEGSVRLVRSRSETAEQADAAEEGPKVRPKTFLDLGDGN